MDTIALRALGLPAPQGSKRVVGGRLMEASAKTRPWRSQVQAEAEQALLGYVIPAFIAGGVEVTLMFVLPRPKGHYGTGRNAAVVKESSPERPAGLPDVDSLSRACLDALTDAGMWGDDSQVVTLVAHKVYADPGVAGIERPGVLVRVERAGGDGQKS